MENEGKEPELPPAPFKALAFGCLLPLKRADVGEGLLCRQLDRTVRETKISRLSQPIDCAQVGKMPH